VPAPDFLFSLDVSDPGAFDAMLDEVSASVFRHAGLPPADAAEMMIALRDELAAAASNGASRCGVQFRARAGELRIYVSAGGRQWHTTRRLPS